LRAQANVNAVFRRLAKPALQPVLNRLRPGNVVMIHIGRCGSRVVADLLDQHSRIYWARELYEPVFKKWRKGNPGAHPAGKVRGDAIQLLRNSMQKALHRYYGFELKPFHLRLLDMAPPAFLQLLDALGFTHFILLDRKNRLRKIVSSIIAHQKGNPYHVSEGRTASKARTFINTSDVRIDYDSKPLLDYLADYDERMDEWERLLAAGRRAVLRLSYEQDIEDDPAVAGRRIFEFLGVRDPGLPVRYRRTNPFPLRELIVNFDEVRALLRGTRYEWMLDG
jgi:hypothetical protein